MTMADDGVRLGLGVSFGEVLEIDAARYMVRVSLDDMEVDADSDAGYWCPVVTPLAGAARGLYLLPDVGDQVAVAFYNGSLADGVVIGGVWRGDQKPPESDEANPRKALVSRSGHRIVLDDTDKAEQIQIVDKTAKNSITIATTDNIMTLVVEGTVNIQAKTAINIEVPDGTLTLACKDLGVKASGAVKLEGQSIELASKSTVKIGGQSVDVNNGALQVK
ncbi:MAG: phage baseplate assembly protein V [Myxococcales bacterium]|nr:phage baseplate assembly protein V [Myxococcales bacterium]